jgi:hypothetical protein
MILNLRMMGEARKCSSPHRHPVFDDSEAILYSQVWHIGDGGKGRVMVIHQNNG